MSLQTIPKEAVEGTIDEPELPQPEKNPSPLSTFVRTFLEKIKPTKDTPRKLLVSVGPPAAGIGIFLLMWSLLAPQVDTQVGSLPGPKDVFDAGLGLYDEYQANNEAKAEFIRTAPAGTIWSGNPTFLDQIATSLQTVAFGFVIGTLIAVPIGLLSGLSKTLKSAINPIVQICKPISPLAWLPIVTMIVLAIMNGPDPILPKSFVISGLVVTLNSLWLTLINTSVGAESVDKDLLNVGEVLRLSPMQKLRKLILPSALPYIFTGMRLSLGVGWMVLIAAEMLAQNPGLGKFVWDEFQNGSSESLSRIMFAVVVIGLIGFMLDRLMSLAESSVRRSMGV